jgi:hypothetical protein
VAKYNETHDNQAENFPLAIYPETNSDKDNQYNIQGMEMKQIHEDFIKSIKTINTEQINYKINDKIWKIKITK